MSEDLKNKAIELGIENAGSLTAAQLKKAVEAVEKKKSASDALKEKAVALGIITAEKTDLEIADAIIAAEDSKALREKALVLGIDAEDITDENLEVIVAYVQEFNTKANDEARETELSEMLSEFLGVDDIYSLSPEEIKVLLGKKEAEKASGIEVVLDKSQDGKTNKSFTVNGKEYMFAEDAPAAFRYLGLRRTQKEWIEDSDALELMVAGKLSFLTFKK